MTRGEPRSRLRDEVRRVYRREDRKIAHRYKGTYGRKEKNGKGFFIR
jgi:hypothetical protein